MFLVKAVAGRTLPDMHSNRRALIGYKHDPSLGENGGFRMLLEPVEVPEMTEYMRAIQCGDLLPADAETAKKCGVPFAGASETKAAASPQKG
jgi:hypothetical protein